MACICGTTDSESLYARAMAYREQGMSKGVEKNGYSFKAQKTLLKTCEVFKKAADQGHLESQYQLSFLFLTHGGAFHEENRRKIEAWYGHNEFPPYSEGTFGFKLYENTELAREEKNLDGKIRADLNYADARYPIFQIGIIYLNRVLNQGHEQAQVDLARYKGVINGQEERTRKAMAKADKEREQEYERQAEQERYEKLHPEVVYQRKIDALQQQNNVLKQKLEDTETDLQRTKYSTSAAQNRVHQLTGRYY